MTAEQAEAPSVSDEYAELREKARKTSLHDARALHELYENMVQETQGDPWQMEHIARAIDLPIPILHEIAENREKLRQAAQREGSVYWNHGHLTMTLPRGRPPSAKPLPISPKPAEQTNLMPLPPRQTAIAPILPPPPAPAEESAPPPDPASPPPLLHDRYRNVFEAIRELGHNADFAPREGVGFVPTTTSPGSREKLEVMAERVRMGFPIHHPEDTDGYDGRTSASGASKQRIA